MSSEDDPFFGGSDKLYYSQEAEGMVHDLESWHVVSGKVDAYQLGLAIGIRHQKKVPLEKPINFGNLYSMRDEWLVKALLFHLHPNEDPRVRKEMMDQYAEAGIRILHTKAAAAKGVVDWQAFVLPP
jgi:hypothetical protein